MTVLTPGSVFERDLPSGALCNIEPAKLLDFPHVNDNKNARFPVANFDAKKISAEHVFT